ncbi:MAG: IS66 family transposase, partial [Terriglobia bacterium]
GREAVIFALLELTKQLAQAQGPQTTPSTPSGMVPVYKKPPAKSRRKRPGAKNGHAGSRRHVPEQIDQQQEHKLPCCPDCGGRLKRTGDVRQRYTEDIPAAEEIQPQVTEHTIHRDWCPKCQKRVEPKVPDALPGAMLGNRVLVLSAWLHYALGNTLSQIVEVFNFHLQLKVTPGGLVQMWYRLQAILYAWYEEIQQQALQSAVLFADETGWRVNGETHWLWCFTTRDLTYYMIDRARGSPALMKFFIQEFGGTLVSDFWGAYNAVVCALRQTCLVHLLRDLEHVDQYKRPSKHWPAFAKKLRRLVGDAIRLWRKQDELPVAQYKSRRDRMHKRLAELIDTPWEDEQARRLVKRLRRHRQDLFTFLDQPGVPFDNNHSERMIRPAVIIRKNSYGNRSERGADCQAVLMSVFRTLKQRGHDPITTICNAIATYLKTGQLPPLPENTASNG